MDEQRKCQRRDVLWPELSRVMEMTYGPAVAVVAISDRRRVATLLSSRADRVGSRDGGGSGTEVGEGRRSGTEVGLLGAGALVGDQSRDALHVLPRLLERRHPVAVPGDRRGARVVARDRQHQVAMMLI